MRLTTGVVSVPVSDLRCELLELPRDTLRGGGTQPLFEFTVHLEAADIVICNMVLAADNSG